MSEQRKRVVVVLGMHRSGTSAVARGLQVLGVELGDRLMPPAADNNEKGFWEDVDANALDRELLQALGREWDSVVPVSRSELDRADLGAFRLRAVELLRDRLADKRMYGLKDPRISVLLPFWKTAFEHVGADVSYVLCARHPLSVARSLNKRDGIEPEKSHYLWLHHVASSILETRGERRVVVGYDLLMQQPEAQLRRIARALGLPFDPASQAFAEYAREFLSEGLRHSVHAMGDLELDPSAPSDMVAAYGLLERFSRDEGSPDDAPALEFFAAVEERLAGMRPALAYMSRRDRRIASLEDELETVVADKDRHIGNIEAALSHRDQRLASLEGEFKAALGDKDRHIGNIEGALSQLRHETRGYGAMMAALDSTREGCLHEARLAEETLQRLMAAKRSAHSTQAARLHHVADSVDAHAEQLRALGNALAVPALRDADESALRGLVDGAASTRSRALEELAECGLVFAQSLQASMGELEVNRMRLADSVRGALRDGAEVSRLERTLAAREAELRERDRVLGQFGHQFVARVGTMLDPYPTVRSVITAPLRFIHWIIGHARA